LPTSLPWDRPEADGCAERFTRVVKELPLWVRCFDTGEELSLALIAFRQTANQSWSIERHGYRTPAQVRADQIGPTLMAAQAQFGVSKLWTGTPISASAEHTAQRPTTARSPPSGSI
jgi:hypothetical protein